MTALAPEPDTDRQLRLTIVVNGRPAPQGSKAYKGHRTNAATGRRSAVLVEQSKRVKPWRALVTRAAMDSMLDTGRTEPLDGPLEADIVFTVLKPASAPKRRRTWPTTRHSGDVDKLIRSTFDGIADGQAVVDDSRIIAITARKTFPGEHPEALDQPGAIIRLYTLPGATR
ncbi:RusA family crossover junction endodeoxyribonuclease [Streptomyces violaceorubidus]|uniref:RusA family crossover junction endodeoxyribonuclease n=1 Tax=Streptomyces violaceorubidus TaxID=284042 RepID=UPI00068C0D06|nr:RusA family crossover junction endodeoxyribonuclease [Streptomyces violaceorubidus]